MLVALITVAMEVRLGGPDFAEGHLGASSGGVL